MTEATTDAAEATSRALSERVAPLEGGLAQQSFAQEDLEGRMHEVRAAMEEVTSHVQSQLEHMHRALQQEQQDATAAVQVGECFSAGESNPSNSGKGSFELLSSYAEGLNALSSPACVHRLLTWPSWRAHLVVWGTLDAASGERSSQKLRKRPADAVDSA